MNKKFDEIEFKDFLFKLKKEKQINKVELHKLVDEVFCDNPNKDQVLNELEKNNNKVYKYIKSFVEKNFNQLEVFFMIGSGFLNYAFSNVKNKKILKNWSDFLKKDFCFIQDIRFIDYVTLMKDYENKLKNVNDKCEKYIDNFPNEFNEFVESIRLLNSCSRQDSDYWDPYITFLTTNHCDTIKNYFDIKDVYNLKNINESNKSHKKLIELHTLDNNKYIYNLHGYSEYYQTFFKKTRKFFQNEKQIRKSPKLIFWYGSNFDEIHIMTLISKIVGDNILIIIRKNPFSFNNTTSYKIRKFNQELDKFNENDDFSNIYYLFLEDYNPKVKLCPKNIFINLTSLIKDVAIKKYPSHQVRAARKGICIQTEINNLRKEIMSLFEHRQYEQINDKIDKIVKEKNYDTRLFNIFIDLATANINILKKVLSVPDNYILNTYNSYDNFLQGLMKYNKIIKIEESEEYFYLILEFIEKRYKKLDFKNVFYMNFLNNTDFVINKYQKLILNIIINVFSNTLYNTELYVDKINIKLPKNTIEIINNALSECYKKNLMLSLNTDRYIEMLFWLREKLKLNINIVEWMIKQNVRSNEMLRILSNTLPIKFIEEFGNYLFNSKNRKYFLDFISKNINSDYKNIILLNSYQILKTNNLLDNKEYLPILKLVTDEIKNKKYKYHHSLTSYDGNSIVSYEEIYDWDSEKLYNSFSKFDINGVKEQLDRFKNETDDLLRIVYKDLKDSIKVNKTFINFIIEISEYSLSSIKYKMEATDLTPMFTSILCKIWESDLCIDLKLEYYNLIDKFLIKHNNYSLYIYDLKNNDNDLWDFVIKLLKDNISPCAIAILRGCFHLNFIGNIIDGIIHYNKRKDNAFDVLQKLKQDLNNDEVFDRILGHVINDDLLIKDFKDVIYYNLEINSKISYIVLEQNQLKETSTSLKEKIRKINYRGFIEYMLDNSKKINQINVHSIMPNFMQNLYSNKSFDDFLELSTSELFINLVDNFNLNNIILLIWKTIIAEQKTCDYNLIKNFVKTLVYIDPSSVDIYDTNYINSIWSIKKYLEKNKIKCENFSSSINESINRINSSFQDIINFIQWNKKRIKKYEKIDIEHIKKQISFLSLIAKDYTFKADEKWLKEKVVSFIKINNTKEQFEENIENFIDDVINNWEMNNN